MNQGTQGATLTSLEKGMDVKVAPKPQIHRAHGSRLAQRLCRHRINLQAIHHQSIGHDRALGYDLAYQWYTVLRVMGT